MSPCPPPLLAPEQPAQEGLKGGVQPTVPQRWVVGRDDGWEANRPHSPFYSGLEVLGIALEKKGPDILEKTMQGKCMGSMLRIIWRLMTSRSPCLGLSSQQMPPRGSEPHSQAVTVKTKNKTPAHGGHTAPSLPCPWVDTTSTASGCSAEESYKKHPVFPAKQMWL